MYAAFPLPSQQSQGPEDEGLCSSHSRLLTWKRGTGRKVHSGIQVVPAGDGSVWSPPPPPRSHTGSAPPQNPDGNPLCLFQDFLTHDAAFSQQIWTKPLCDLDFYFFWGLVSFLNGHGHVHATSLLLRQLPGISVPFQSLHVYFLRFPMYLPLLFEGFPIGMETENCHYVRKGSIELGAEFSGPEHRMRPFGAAGVGVNFLGGCPCRWSGLDVSGKLPALLCPP